MEITLTPELEKFISRKIKSGTFSSPNEAVNELLRRRFEAEEADRRAKKEDLRREIQKGIDAIREGNFKSYDSADEMIEDVIKEARTEFENGKQNGKKV
jgi:antitoxin ParD1/3/4